MWSQNKQGKEGFNNPDGITILKSVSDRGLRMDMLCQGMNSGYQAINLAYMQGADAVLLLGFVMSGTGSHWFGSHPEDLDQNTDYSGFISAFDLMKPQKYGLTVINCTENTALTCFTKMTLDDALKDCKKRWKECVVIASGPSLTPEQVNQVEKWRFDPEKGHERGVIVTNSSYIAAPWADILYGMDKNWWNHEVGQAAIRDFKGEKVSTQPVDFPEVTQGNHYTPPRSGMNSGSGGISLAAHYGATKIVVLGCDACVVVGDQTTTEDRGGKRHWHGDHPRGLGNAKSVPKFYAQFQHMAEKFKELEIINCSPISRLDFWPKMSIEKALS